MLRTTISASRPVTRVTCLVMTVVAFAACHPPFVSSTAAAARLTPSVDFLRPLGAGVRSDDSRVWRYRPGVDTSAQLLTRVRVDEGPAPGDSARAIVVTTWAAPFASMDSLLVDRRTLAPVHEVLLSGGDRYEYAYTRGRVSGSVAKRDSASRVVGLDVREPVFAFNQVQGLVEALPYRRHLVLVVPLFSEIDGAVEHDTISVLERAGAGPEDGTWTVRFADPVITSVYRVDAHSHTVVECTTRNRKSGTTYFIKRSE